MIEWIHQLQETTMKYRKSRSSNWQPSANKWENKINDKILKQTAFTIAFSRWSSKIYHFLLNRLAIASHPYSKATQCKYNIGDSVCCCEWMTYFFLIDKFHELIFYVIHQFGLIFFCFTNLVIQISTWPENQLNRINQVKCEFTLTQWT